MADPSILLTRCPVERVTAPSIVTTQTTRTKTRGRRRKSIEDFFNNYPIEADEISSTRPLSNATTRTTTTTKSTATHLLPSVISKQATLLFINVAISLSFTCGSAHTVPKQSQIIQIHQQQQQTINHRYTRSSLECATSSDCEDPDRICFEQKCICKRSKPVEDNVNNKCLEPKIIGEPCYLTEQCLGNSECIQGNCSCSFDAVKIFNPSTQLFYCHEKKKLNELCTSDPQCPYNSYCSIDKFGCLCSNGYEASNGRCMPKRCSNTTECESEFHRCQENLCMCEPGHFDVTQARCYKFGSRGGKDDSEGTIFNQITSDRFWILVVVIISIVLMAFVFIFVFKKHYLRYCFTSYKKEYEPNNKSAPKNGFHSNPINNKSFKRKYDNDTVNSPIGATPQSADQLRKSSEVDMNLDVSDNDEHAVMISDKNNRPLVTSTSTTV